MELPAITDIIAYHRHFNDEVWQTVAGLICARHKIPYTTLRRSQQGENIIFFIDEAFVLKIFAPFRENYERERAALEFTHGKISIRTPELAHTGEFEGWSYLVMTRLAGHASREVWEQQVPLRDRLEILTHLGGAMSELHAHAAPLQRPALGRDWPGFLERQAQSAVERQRACNANPEWLESLPSFINARLKLLPEPSRQVFLHGDIHAGNLLLGRRGGRWRIAGLIDFGDSLCGFHEYEFVAPGVLMAQGRSDEQRAMLLAYGYGQAELDSTFRARLMLLTVLYECSDLRKYAQRLFPEAVNFTLDELERAIWAFAK
jgi:hygromycin-B 7''-O-kinase